MSERLCASDPAARAGGMAYACRAWASASEFDRGFPDPEPRRVRCKAPGLNLGIDPIHVQAGLFGAPCGKRFRLHDGVDLSRRFRLEADPKMLIQMLHRAHRVADEVPKMNVKDRFGERLLIGGLDHQLGRVGPALTFLPGQRESIQTPAERASEHLRQSKKRTQHLKRVAMHEHELEHRDKFPGSRRERKYGRDISTPSVRRPADVVDVAKNGGETDTHQGALHHRASGDNSARNRLCQSADWQRHAR